MTKKIRVGIHIPQAVHRAAKQTAAFFGTNLSAVVSALLTNFVTQAGIADLDEPEDDTAAKLQALIHTASRPDEED